MNLTVTDPHTDPHSQNSVLKQLVNYRLVGLENQYTCMGIEGSNPSLSASYLGKGL